jgi:Uma2 family endonuclease
MGALATAHITIEEYLSNPAYEHCEYLDGEPVELNVGTPKHAAIQVACGSIFKEYFRKHPGGYVGAELHCRLNIGGKIRFRLPDIAVVLNPKFKDDRYLDGAPDLVIEIRSPEDTVSSQIRKFEDYFANGAKLGWLILPEEQSVLVLAPNAAIQAFTSGQTLTGGDLLPDCSIPVEYLFD